MKVISENRFLNWKSTVPCNSPKCAALLEVEYSDLFRVRNVVFWICPVCGHKNRAEAPPELYEFIAECGRTEETHNGV